ncbi:MAG TPA: HD domain-containing phosphohydrolase [Anaerolineae bacterium]|nr:HD domain-containing phosphohydrolase [Anaerolineae bacterium]
MTSKYQHSILLVDDEVSITESLKRIFRKEDYRIFTASSGKEGLELLNTLEEPVSLIISDQRMPEMTGTQFLEKARKIFPDAGRYLMTGYSDMDAVIDAVNKGKIHRYLSKPWNDDELLVQVRQLLERYELTLENRRLLELTSTQNKELNELNKNLEKKVSERTLEVRQKNIALEETNKKLEESFLDTIRLMSSLIENLNPELGRYMKHVAQLARKVAEEYGLDSEELDQIEIAGMIHDVGMLGSSPRELLKDEEDMREEELKMYRQHPVIASICLETVERLNKVSKIVLYHHENFDGSGFPNGLKGDEIPLGSRIIGAAADYCNIAYRWPKDIKYILDKARIYFGPATRNFNVTEPEKMIEEVAPKIIMIGAHQKYDIGVVTKLIKIAGEAKLFEKEKKSQELRIGYEKLKEGMILAQDLHLKDGRLLLASGREVKKLSVASIQKLGKNELIDEWINVFI